MYIKYTKIYFIYSILLKYYILKQPCGSAMLFALKKGAKWRIPVQLGGPKCGPSHRHGALAPTPRALSLLLFPTPRSCSRKPQWSGLGTGGVEGTWRADWAKEDTWPLRRNNTAAWGVGCVARAAARTLSSGTHGCGTATPPEESIPTEYFSTLFLVQNKCKGAAGWGVAQAGPAPSADLRSWQRSWAQLRGVEVLLLRRICRPSK